MKSKNYTFVSLFLYKRWHLAFSLWGGSKLFSCSLSRMEEGDVVGLRLGLVTLRRNMKITIKIKKWLTNLDRNLPFSKKQMFS
jgi:hypothetical protein